MDAEFELELSAFSVGVCLWDPLVDWGWTQSLELKKSPNSDFRRAVSDANIAAERCERLRGVHEVARWRGNSGTPFREIDEGKRSQPGPLIDRTRIP